ncbi:hypothetical protein DEO72_LG6g887 [Vigna unguiculata]|uniref:Uncharacterized protein n=1 Tax=Vigna unguiculata TaxID=3917 RepID=A0A4D6M4T8_VIGUN|nr:hypothetical protein DEO72_LG6g887 [Vigna unguiculata]
MSVIQKHTHSLQELNPEKESWNILARVVRLWFVEDYTKGKTPFSMEIVLQDQEDLQSDFAYYVRKRRLRRLELQGRNNTFIVQCKLLLRNTPKKSSKIGKGWKDFCTFNRLEEGDILVFLADKKMKKKKIKVYVHKECNF